MHPRKRFKLHLPPPTGLASSLLLLLLLLGLGLAMPPQGSTAPCARTVIADVVALDNPMMFNRLGAQNINFMVYSLRRNVVNKADLKPEAAGGVLAAGQVMLRPDLRPRPLVVRVSAGDCLQVNFQNLLAPAANPNQAPLGVPMDNELVPFNLQINDQVADRFAGFHPQGMQLVGDINSDSSFVGNNANSLVAPGGSATYTYFAEKEGTFLVTSYGATFGGEGSGGNVGNGLFGAVNVEPTGARFYRSQVTEEELRLATDADQDGRVDSNEKTKGGQPILPFGVANQGYEARYPNVEPWISEGKAGLPILNMLDGNRLVHSDINAIIAGPNANGTFPASTYPLESVGKRNPTVPNRLEPFREFSSIWNDEVAVAQAFPGWFLDPVLRHTLHGVRDGFMINYGSGGIGTEIISNRLAVGPMHDCLTCAYEEFFLASSTVGDPAMLVDVPANVGLELCDPNLNNCPVGAMGPKATKAFFPDDPSNVHHSYIGDFAKFRNVHSGGKEHHVFHLHNHQWLFNANDDNANYLDAQGIGPGSSGYTYEINFGGSGNRNKTSGDAIFHCHFYPHFAQGMWYLWRVHDVFEAGTQQAVTPLDNSGRPMFHTTPWALGDGTPATGARALPDGEIVAGTPIPALVPLPGKPMAPVPGAATVKANPNRTVASLFHPDSPGQSVPVGSLANVLDRAKNPGFPFWIGGSEHTVGQRPTTPPLDMLTEAQATALQQSNPLFAKVSPALAGGFDGGLPRHTLDGYAAGGASLNTQTRLDMSKVVEKARPVFFPEEGTDVEQAAMTFHAKRCHDTFRPDGTAAKCVNNAGGFIVNGAPPVPSAPYNDPCIDDKGTRFVAGQSGQFFSVSGFFSATPEFGADNPRVYKGANIQIDAVLNKVGWHFPQQRIITLWEDVAPTMSNQRPPEPFVMRLNTFDCAKYLHTNLVPEVYELDDFQVRTPTDIIGQHIHLPKWDLTSTDGSANGWNYEDGTLSPGAVRERIHAINCFNGTGPCPEGITPGPAPVPTLDGRTTLVAQPHPFFGAGPGDRWLGARTTIQRWFADPVVNVDGVDRGLGIVFTHDHYGPSTHQQVGLYSTLLTEPARSTWKHNETGVQLGTRHDGGPTTWQAAILPPNTADSFREFYFEYSDFQSAYEAGFGVTAGGEPAPPTADTFRHAINPSVKQAAAPLFPDIVRFPPICPGGVPRPCPEAISADEPGTFVTNYRNEPVGLRVFDPNALGPDGKPGTQAGGDAGDLARALETRRDRAIPALNTALGNTPYPPLTADLQPGDPFPPMMRAYAGDTVRVKIQAGGDEETHLATIHGVKWLQGGSGHGQAPNSGWRNAQQGGISEQFTLKVPVIPFKNQIGNTADYAYSQDASQDGWWNGMWGLLRTYNAQRADLFQLPTTSVPVNLANAGDFDRVCPRTAPVRAYDITAVLANNVLDNPLGVAIIPNDLSATQHVGGPLNPNGGTLVYNPRATALTNGEQGPLHDPTGILYVRTADLDGNGKLRLGVPIEPVVLRAAAGECIQVTLRNELPRQAPAPDLAGLTTLPLVVNRDRNDVQGLTTFNNNLIRPSSLVGLHPQLVAYDVTRDDGVIVGTNPSNQLVAPGQFGTLQWYAGDIAMQPAGGSRINLVATPVELGGSNLTPTDKIKQGQKGLVGALVIEPAGSTWAEDADMRAAATVTAASGSFRDFAVVHQKGLNHRYADGSAVENIASEDAGVPEDSEDSGQMAINYGSEPLWFRFGIRPDAPLGNVAGGLGAVPNAHEAYSNNLAGVGGDPATPVFTAAPGQAFRMRVLLPTGVGRGSVFDLHGHLWQRDPYICPGSAKDGLTGKCTATEVASRAIGLNPIGWYLGGQESILPNDHFDIVLPSAGGVDAVAGDYLFRDKAGFGNLSGLWGILRVGTTQ